jgi:hypothetical protein
MNKPLLSLLFLAFFYFLAQYLFDLTVVVCPSKILYGLPCPSCGVTRALLSIFKGDLLASLYYNFLWATVLVLGIVISFNKKSDKILPNLTSINNPLSYLFWFTVILQWIVNLATNK